MLTERSRKEVVYVKLLTKELLRRLPPLYATENDADPVVHVKFFCPGLQWAWYGIEFDGENLCFGLVDGNEQELGYFSLFNLIVESHRSGRSFERDRSFRPCRLSELRAMIRR